MGEPRKILTIEQVQFLENYLLNFNLDEACDRSGMSKKDGEETLQHPVVKEIVEREHNFRFRRLTVSASRTILSIAEIAYKEPMIATDPTELALRQAALSQVSDKDSLKALETLCKYQETLGLQQTGAAKEKDIIDEVSTPEGALALMKRMVGIKK